MKFGFFLGVASSWPGAFPGGVLVLGACAPALPGLTVVLAEARGLSEASNLAETALTSNLNLDSKLKLGFNTDFDSNPYLTSTQITAQTQP